MTPIKKKKENQDEFLLKVDQFHSKILCWGPLMTWGAAAPIRMRVVTQMETQWRHSDDASTDVSNPPPPKKKKHAAHECVNTHEANGVHRGRKELGPGDPRPSTYQLEV
jgi:hypothetical protein